MVVVLTDRAQIEIGKQVLRNRGKGQPHRLVVKGTRSHLANHGTNPSTEDLKNTLGMCVFMPQSHKMEILRRDYGVITLPWELLSSALSVSLQ